MRNCIGNGRLHRMFLLPFWWMLAVLLAVVPAAVKAESRVLADYDTLAAALDAFDRSHSHAPHARAGVFLLRTAPPSGNQLEGVRLWLDADGRTVDIPVADDGVFVLPLDSPAFKRGSKLMVDANRDIGLRIHVRSPNLPSDVRRLGDLRLEAVVMRVIAREKLGGLLNWIFASATKNTGYNFYADAPIKGITLIDGERTLVFTPGLVSDGGFEGYKYHLPLHRAGWSDDTVVKLQLDAPSS